MEISSNTLLHTQSLLLSHNMETGFISFIYFLDGLCQLGVSVGA